MKLNINLDDELKKERKETVPPNFGQPTWVEVNVSDENSYRKIKEGDVDSYFLKVPLYTSIMLVVTDDNGDDDDSSGGARSAWGD